MINIKELSTASEEERKAHVYKSHEFETVNNNTNTNMEKIANRHKKQKV